MLKSVAFLLSHSLRFVKRVIHFAKSIGSETVLKDGGVTIEEELPFDQNLTLEYYDCYIICPPID